MRFKSPNVVSFEKHRKSMPYHEYIARKKRHFEASQQNEKGHRYERIVLGECQISQVEQVDPGATKHEAIRFAMDHQPEEKAGALKWIEIQMRNHSLASNDIELYTAVGSPLDYDFGADAFIKAGGQYFTIDYTIGSKKAKKMNSKSSERVADMILELDLDMEEEEKLEAINAFARYATGYVDGTLKSIREYQEAQGHKVKYG